MNKARVVKLEDKAETLLGKSKTLPYVWRIEEGKIAIVDSPWILDRLKKLGREIVYSPYIFTAIYIDPDDKEIVDRVEGNYLYLVGLKQPISGLPELIFYKSENEKD